MMLTKKTNGFSTTIELTTKSGDQIVLSQSCRLGKMELNPPTVTLPEIRGQATATRLNDLAATLKRASKYLAVLEKRTGHDPMEFSGRPVTLRNPTERESLDGFGKWLAAEGCPAHFVLYGDRAGVCGMPVPEWAIEAPATAETCGPCSEYLEGLKPAKEER